MRTFVLLLGVALLGACGGGGDGGTGPGGDGPTISGIAPATLTPGAAATITGSNFSTTPASNLVTVAGVAATVTAATATQLTVQLPPASSFTCDATRPVTVSVAVAGEAGSRQHPLQIATLRTIAVGDRLVISSAAEVRCNELAQTGGRYLVTVYNTNFVNLPPSRLTAPTAAVFEFRGAAGIASPEPIPEMPVAAARATHTPGSFARPARLAFDEFFGETAVRRERERRHVRLLEANIEILRANAARAGRWGPGYVAPDSRSISAPGGIRRAVDPTLGANNSIRVPNINVNNFCNQYTEVTARTVYNGTRTIILVDNANENVAGMDALYAQLGQMFDQQQFAVLMTNFGNPLAMDAVTDGNGKIVMVFSKAVNDLGGVAGFVVSCDFFTRATTIGGLANESSNFGEFFYAFAPCTQTTCSAQNVIPADAWFRSIKSTIIHEVKHITSFGERIARNAVDFELPALEEGTARHSEELWARQHLYNQPWKGDITYDESIFCDVRPNGQAGGPHCVGAPFAVFRHFDALYTYMSSPEGFTPLGRTGTGDFNFYASMWSFVRWAIDNFAATEAGFLSGMTQSATLSGLPNISAQTGRTPEEMIPDWLLSLYLDNLAGFTPAAGLKLSIPTWDHRDIFLGMNEDFCPPPIDPDDDFCRVYPLQPRAVTFGAAFASGAISVRGGSGAFFEISGTQTARQLVEVRAPGGGPPPAELRVAIVRIQ